MAEAEIVQGAVWALLQAPAPAVALVMNALTFNVPGAQYTPAYKAGSWNGKTCLLRRISRQFPAGLASRVECVLRDAGYSVRTRSDIARRPVQLPAGGSVLQGVELRPYQRAVVARALALGRAVIKSPTGSGKTEIGAALVAAIRCPTLWVCHRADLMHQTVDRLVELLGQPVGAVGSKRQDEHFVTVGMVPSLRKFPKEWWLQWQVLVLDECHHTGAVTWLEVADACSAAPWRFGLSATPQTTDELRDARLEGAAGPLLVAETTERLVAQGFLARPQIRMLVPPAASYPTYEEIRAAVLPDWRNDPRRLMQLGGKLYAEAYRRGVVENDERTYLLGATVARHARDGEKVLVLFTDILHGHGERLFNRIADCCGSAVPVWVLDGRDPSEDRKAVVSQFKSQRRGAVLVASGIFSEGVNIPELDVLVLAAGGKAELLVLQRLGRALRPRPDKSEVLIYDVLDGVSAHARKDYLAQHSTERLRVYRAQGFAVEVWHRP